jgi:hypothetical protein
MNLSLEIQLLANDPIEYLLRLETHMVFRIQIANHVQEMLIAMNMNQDFNELCLVNIFRVVLLS